MSNRAEQAAQLRATVASNPSDRVAWHNLASAEGDLGRAAESEAAARHAIALGIPAPETRLVLARALQFLGRLDEAEDAFAQAIMLRPAYPDAQRDLAQLRWMRTGNSKTALRALDATLRSNPNDAALHGVRSIILEFAGDAAGALAAADAGLRHAPGQAALLRQAAQLCIRQGDTARALALAEQAERGDPAAGALSVCEALLATGRLAEAETKAAALRRADPHNQYALALQGSAWRLMGDARYATLHDYATLIQAQRLDTPAGWPSLEAFLAELAADLDTLHPFAAHPLQQSVRGGSQRTLQEADLARPPVRALFASIVTAIERYVEHLGAGSDPLRSRNTGRAGISGAWSVRLRSGGHHVDHVHPRGWISSACHIVVPAAVTQGDPGHPGWLRLGRPGVPTQPPLGADHFVRPEPGRLVLFPAYMWHGVEPFVDDGPRLSVAFDVVPV